MTVYIRPKVRSKSRCLTSGSHHRQQISNDWRFLSSFNNSHALFPIDALTDHCLPFFSAFSLDLLTIAHINYIPNLRKYENQSTGTIPGILRDHWPSLISRARMLASCLFSPCILTSNFSRSPFIEGSLLWVRGQNIVLRTCSKEGRKEARTVANMLTSGWRSSAWWLQIAMRLRNDLAPTPFAIGSIYHMLLANDVLTPWSMVFWVMIIRFVQWLSVISSLDRHDPPSSGTVNIHLSAFSFAPTVGRYGILTSYTTTWPHDRLYNWATVFSDWRVLTLGVIWFIWHIQIVLLFNPARSP